jgi:hypothetical protein
MSSEPDDDPLNHTVSEGLVTMKMVQSIVIEQQPTPTQKKAIGNHLS